MREVAIIGVGIHRFGRFPDKSFGILGRDAVLDALNDAGVQWKEIQAVYAGSLYQATSYGHSIVRELGRTGAPIVNIENQCATGLAVFMQAWLAVASGFYDIVCAVGAEKQPRGLIPLPQFPMWQRYMGFASGAASHAYEAQRLIHEGRATREQLAMVSIKSHNNASLCHFAHYQDNAGMTVEDVINARLICYPLTLYEICPTSEGGAAVILCAKEIVDRYPDVKPVTVVTCVGTSGVYDRYRSVGLGANDSSLSEKLAPKAYEMAGVGPEDLDVAEVEDSSVAGELFKYENLGFCKEGEAGRLIQEGETQIGGRLPVNPDGGHVSRGNPMGCSALAEVLEVALQLRGDAGPRQVEGAKLGLVEAYGGGPNELIAILKR
ncbi:thiolase family protein [Chloroflexota bacterium]